MSPLGTDAGSPGADGSAVVITGGTRGIGLGIARAFLEAGSQVLVCGRTPPADVPSAAGPRRVVLPGGRA